MIVKTTTYRSTMQNVRTATMCSCDLLMETTLVDWPHPCSLGSTGNGGINGLKQFRASTFYTPAEKHGISSVTLQVGHDIPIVTLSSRLTPSDLSWLETGDVWMFIASRLDSYLKRSLTSGGPQHQVQWISLKIYIKRIYCCPLTLKAR